MTEPTKPSEIAIVFRDFYDDEWFTIPVTPDELGRAIGSIAGKEDAFLTVDGFMYRFHHYAYITRDDQGPKTE